MHAYSMLVRSALVWRSGIRCGAQGIREPVEKGLIDPTKVVRVVLENAVSEASLLLLKQSVAPI